MHCCKFNHLDLWPFNKSKESKEPTSLSTMVVLPNIWILISMYFMFTSVPFTSLAWEGQLEYNVMYAYVYGKCLTREWRVSSVNAATSYLKSQKG